MLSMHVHRQNVQASLPIIFSFHEKPKRKKQRVTSRPYIVTEKAQNTSNIAMEITTL